MATRISRHLKSYLWLKTVATYKRATNFYHYGILHIAYSSCSRQGWRETKGNCTACAVQNGRCSEGCEERSGCHFVSFADFLLPYKLNLMQYWLRCCLQENVETLRMVVIYVRTRHGGYGGARVFIFNNTAFLISTSLDIILNHSHKKRQLWFPGNIRHESHEIELDKIKKNFFENFAETRSDRVVDRIATLLIRSPFLIIQFTTMVSEWM